MLLVNRFALTALLVLGVSGMLRVGPAQAGGAQRPPRVNRPTPPAHTADASSAAAGGSVADGALYVTDANAIAQRWGIRIESMRLTSSGYMLDFRYRVVDARKAKPLFERKTKPVLRDDATGVEVAVPVPPKTGALRNSNDPKVGRTYFMFFANPARFIKAGNLVTVTIGAFRVSGLRVATEDEAKPRGADQERSPAAEKAVSAKVMASLPAIGEIALVDHHGGRTTLRQILETDQPVLLNFIFTTCTTICPVMSAGFSQFQAIVDAEGGHVRLVSISIDPKTDTVDVLRAYAERHGAGPSWLFLTGTESAVEAAQRTFGAYRGDASNHAPVTYFRRSSESPWEALEGLSSAEALRRLYKGDGTRGGW